MSTVLLDTHVVHWWSAEPDRLSSAATELIESASTLAVAAISWYELAWLATHGRIVLTVPVRAWLDDIAAVVRTVGVTPGIAAAAAALPPGFPGDPADRLIYASALEHGWTLVTKDRRLLEQPSARPIALW